MSLLTLFLSLFYSLSPRQNHALPNKLPAPVTLRNHRPCLSSPSVYLSFYALLGLLLSLLPDFSSMSLLLVASS
jgi:hypothetical protein